jgi:hypothetical protein
MFTLLLGLSLNSQSFELGMGSFSTNQRVFETGHHYQLGIGYRVSKILMPAVSCIVGISPDIHRVSNLYSLQDTFYGVNQTESYKMRLFVFNPRLFLSPAKWLSVTFSPLLGFADLWETIKHEHPQYNSTRKYGYSCKLYGTEFGLEVPLIKKKFFINTSWQIMRIRSEDQVLHMYTPAFNQTHMTLQSLQLRLRWDFGKLEEK